MADANATVVQPKKAGGTDRSPNYPQYTLTEAIALVQKLYDKEKRTVVSSEAVARSLGYGGLSGTARSAIATLRQYGLVEKTAGGMRVSDTALAILHQPAESQERNEALRDAAMKPALISELANTHADASDDSLKGFLVTKKAFTPDAAGRFIAAFRDSLTIAKAGQPGYNGRKDGAGPKIDPLPNPGSGTSPHPASKPGARMEFNWVLSGDAVATMTVSRAIDAEDIETLASFFEIAKKALLKAARANQASADSAPAKAD